MANVPRLVLLPSLSAFVQTDGRFVLTRKFIAGVEEHARHWPGSVHVILNPAAAVTNNLDNVAVDSRDLTFDVTILSHRSPALAGYLKVASVVLLILYHEQAHIAHLCHRLGVPVIYTSEYTLKTRLQIIATTTVNPLRRIAKEALEWYRERQLASAVRAANGLQCNGTPTFEAYKAINADPMLFFDTRLSDDMLADEGMLVQRFARRRDAGVLRLGFSGRLIAMKGADHLIAVAKTLRDMRRPFHMTIFGAGELEDSMRDNVAADGLQELVTMAGNVDFESELVPYMRDQVDLFVCCHRQGDPSCTYLETMACGIPIAGYANEAFEGVARVSGTGWVTPMNRPDRLAECIAAVDDEELERHSRASLAFATEHTFGEEFSRRMEHVRRIAGLN